MTTNPVRSPQLTIGVLCLAGVLLGGGVFGTATTLTQEGRRPRAVPTEPPPDVQDFPSPNAGRQASPNVRRSGAPDIAQIIERFTENESLLLREFANYIYRQEVRMQTLGIDDRPTGEYYRLSEVSFTESGQRREEVKRLPPSTLQGIQVTPADLEDFGATKPFAITKEDAPLYNIEYVGRERLDELDTYVFEVRPKRVPKFQQGGKRFFMGRVWVDTQDLMVVKSAGRTLPEDKNNKFPRFESYRENIEGRFWFPTYVYADDVLDFPSGSVHIRLEIRYTNYRRFQTDVKVID
ncbi:MAG: hypothetical protein NZ585_03190 [Chloracidobacterium sp.]|nr:hypothetical protein [Chloracidobacterium sp.]MDW8217249.1 hypothetical protein [Acidobacteriota bacterium]